MLQKHTTNLKSIGHNSAGQREFSKRVKHFMSETGLLWVLIGLMRKASFITCFFVVHALYWRAINCSTFNMTPMYCFKCVYVPFNFHFHVYMHAYCLMTCSSNTNKEGFIFIPVQTHQVCFIANSDTTTRIFYHKYIFPPNIRCEQLIYSLNP